MDCLELLHKTAEQFNSSAINKQKLKHDKDASFAKDLASRVNYSDFGNDSPCEYEPFNLMRSLFWMNFVFYEAFSKAK